MRSRSVKEQLLDLGIGADLSEWQQLRCCQYGWNQFMNCYQARDVSRGNDPHCCVTVHRNFGDS